MIKYQVPFYSNTKDDWRCMHAVYKMVLKFFLPNKNFTFKTLDQMLRSEKGKGTWSAAGGPVALKEMGFEIVHIEPFDYQRFYREGEKYLASYCDEKAAQWYREKTNIKIARKHTPEFLNEIKPQKREATLNDIEELLSDRFLVGAEINCRALEGKPEYAGHFVLIFGFDKDDLYLHDPGLPPRPNLTIDKKIFQKAWQDSRPNLTAFYYAGK